MILNELVFSYKFFDLRVSLVACNFEQIHYIFFCNNSILLFCKLNNKFWITNSINVCLSDIFCAFIILLVNFRT